MLLRTLEAVSGGTKAVRTETPTTPRSIAEDAPGVAYARQTASIPPLTMRASGRRALVIYD
jgi:hypothetical protein